MEDIPQTKEMRKYGNKETSLDDAIKLADEIDSKITAAWNSLGTTIASGGAL